MSSKENLAKCQIRRQIEDNYAIQFQREMQVTENLMSRLGCEKELKGHTGCVNCLDWNEKGTLIASGSDDYYVMLWDPFRQKQLESIRTGHAGNIFTVKFLPNFGDRIILTGSADRRVKIHDLTSKVTLMSCDCHGGRVKRIAASPSVPDLFWSASEDGNIMQYDYRISHRCSDTWKNVLIKLTYHLGGVAQAKCVAINPLRPELLAVGASDPFVRLYDRRMIKPIDLKPPNGDLNEQFEDNLLPGCVSYFVAGHIPPKQDYFRRRLRSLTTTYVAFSPDGSEMLANLGGEQIYLFKVFKRRKPMSFDLSKYIPPTRETEEALLQRNSSTVNGLSRNTIAARCWKEDLPNCNDSRHSDSASETWHVQILPPSIEEIKERGNVALENREFVLAINLYSEAIWKYPNGAPLYANRAAAYLKRSWDGDIYAALRDCYIAMQLDPNYMKVHFRFLQCLYRLQWFKEAWVCLQSFKKKFPSVEKNAFFVEFENNVRRAVLHKTGAGADYLVKDEMRSWLHNLMADVPDDDEDPNPPILTAKEKAWRASAFDYDSRFCGHCNITTDIKEANFFGSDGKFIVAGSDDGLIFIWNKETTNIVKIIRGDDAIVNCIQPHPATCLLATSGIDPVVRLWEPKDEDTSNQDQEVINFEETASSNQRRMNAEPMEVLLRSINHRVPREQIQSMTYRLEETISNVGPVECQPS